MNWAPRILVGVLLLAAGCSAYDDDFQYMPRPAIAQVPTTEPQSPPAATALATVVGVRNPDQSQAIPLSVEVRLQLQNSAPEVMTFDPRSLVLTDGSLMNFPPPVDIPPSPMALEPGQTASLMVHFPFAPGTSPDTLQMSPLQLRWVEQIGSQPFPQSVFFTRVYPAYPYYYGPYYGYPGYPSVFITGRFVYVHRR